ncbi:MAG: hypothetical protein CL686_01165 [Candidatus Nitrosopelagicus sp.]|nr:hypothetical protein [Candidatus Nitrosopelagicus sp.]|tara:strand:+ start:159 stop:371 length:213 start_codon:yes stop_codon:yes gene_type:complete
MKDSRPMATLCYNCRKDIETHDSQKSSNCLATLSKRLESMENVLQVPNDDEALDYFSNTKLGEASRMGSK